MILAILLTITRSFPDRDERAGLLTGMVQDTSSTSWQRFISLLP